MSSREWDAETYHALSDPQFEWGKKVLGRLRLRGDETVLDAGCGTGRLTIELLRMLPRGRVVAVDLSESMLSVARGFLAPHAEHVSFVCADLQQLPFRERFDVIFSNAALHWVRDHPRLFCSLFTALKPTGSLVAQCGGGPNLARLRQHAAAVMASPAFASFFRGWSEPWEFASADLTAERLRQAGFVNIKTWTEPAGYTLPDAPAFERYLAAVGLNCHLKQIPDPALREQFMHDVSASFGSTGPFALDYWRLNLNAVRLQL